MTTVSAFFDESGKFKDHKVISIAGVASFAQEFQGFGTEWERLLRTNGLSDLSAKNVLNPNRALSKKNTEVGLQKRIGTLLPFVLCIRKHLQVVTGVAVDVAVFRKLPSHFFQILGHDPAYVAFLRSMLRVVEFTPSKDKINLICDDEEQTALPFYHLYRRMKKVLPEAKEKMASISFADDRYLFGLQASDFVSSIIRQQVTKEMKRVKYDYEPLFTALTKSPEPHERLWTVEIAKGGRTTLLKLADDMKKEINKAKSA